MSLHLVAFFIAGLFSFLSPCILPILPGYMGMIGAWGMEGENRRKKLLVILFFVAGFSLVFTTLGFTATLLGNVLSVAKDVFSRIGGIVIILLGLHLTGIVNIPFLNYEKRIPFSGIAQHQSLTAFLAGVVFSAGWSPCIGPILGSLLTALVIQTTSWVDGVLYLFVYSLGLAVPIFLLGIMENEILGRLIARKKIMHYIQVGSGVFLCITGLMLLLDLQPIFSAVPSLFSL